MKPAIFAVFLILAFHNVSARAEMSSPVVVCTIGAWSRQETMHSCTAIEVGAAYLTLHARSQFVCAHALHSPGPWGFQHVLDICGQIWRDAVRAGLFRWRAHPFAPVTH